MDFSPKEHSQASMGAAHSLPHTSSGNAHPHLNPLQIPPNEVERLCGLEFNELWVGNLWVGAYRSGALRRSPLTLLTTELLIMALAGMVSLPLGLLLVRNPSSADPEAARAAIPFAITVAIGMGSLLLLRSHRMSQNRRRWRSLLNILDEIDRYHDTIQTLELLEQFQEINISKPPQNNEHTTPNNHTTRPNLELETAEALRLTRDSLVTGLLADKLLRQQHSQNAERFRKTLTSKSRYIDLLEHLDQNLATLTALDVSEQLNHETQLLQDALQISIAVRSSITEQQHPSQIQP